MAKISPRKAFNFRIIFPGYPLEPFLVQKCQLPEMEIESVPHSEGNIDIKTGGRIKVGNCTLENIMKSTSGAEANFFWDWAGAVQDMYLNGGLEPFVYYRTMIIEEVGVDGKSTINRWVLDECWPSKMNGLSLDRKSSDNTLETVELSVNRIDKLY